MRVRRLSFKFGSSTENKNQSPPLHEEPDTKQNGDSTLPSFVIGFLIHYNLLRK